jgi:hypothetical protein
MSCEDHSYHFKLMPTKLSQVISSFLTQSTYKKLAMSVTWQFSPGTPTPLQNYSCAWIEIWWQCEVGSILQVVFRLSWPWRTGHFGRHILHRQGILPFVGGTSSQNSRVRCAHNPHVFQESPLHDEKIGVWVGMSHRRIVRPIFFSETLNSQQYSDNIVYPFNEQLKED